MQFQTLYNRLNPRQKEAVDAIEGPVMVIAGPGTGKTQILTLRIANILKRVDIPPDAVLALTFTEAGVYAMRKRLVEIMGSPAYRVGIFTFHSFCNELIRRYPDEFPRIVGSQNINEIDKIQILRQLFDAAEDLKRLKPFGDPYYYLRHAISAISDLKRENISPTQAATRVTAQRTKLEAAEDLYHERGAHAGKMKGKYADEFKKIEKNEELVLLYERYEEQLRERKLYDYEDMIIETVAALKRNEQFLLTLQEEYQYLLADEHQDANNSQNQLLELLASFHESPNLFLVGDEKQAIYRFQGASLENFLYFKNRYPDAKLIQLEENYRSRQLILDATQSLIEKGALSDHERRAPLRSTIDRVEEKSGAPQAADGDQQHAHILEHVRMSGGEQIEVASFSRPAHEAFFVARATKRLIDEGVPPHEIAVLYRLNSDAEALIPAFEKVGVPYVIESDQNILADEDMRKYIALIRAVAHFGEDEFLAPVLYTDFIGVEPLDVYKLLWHRRQAKTGAYALLKSEKLLRDAGIEDIGKLRDLFHKLAAWNKLAHNRGLLSILEIIASESGFLTHLMEDARGREKLEKFSSFIRDAEQLVELHREYRLRDFVHYLDLLAEHNLSIKRREGRVATPSVRLMTAHKAKGLEFDYVFVTQAFEGHWGNRRQVEHFTIPIFSPDETSDGVPRSTPDPTDDERRLFYVAVTRARHGATITYSREHVNGRQQLPTQFLQEIDPRYLDERDMSEFEASVDPLTLLAPRQVQPLPALDKAYLRDLFLEQGLSPTALNNFLHSPWEYFFGNLLRVPKSPDKHMLFGTAVHGALRDLFERLREGEEADAAYLLSRFRDHLARQPLSSHEYEEALTKGEQALSGYYNRYAKEFGDTLGNEWSIAVSFPLEGGVRIPLRGVLDKVERIDESRVRVVDYKTGRPKSRNEIEGKTKTSEGDYKRQLVFYKLLLSMYEDGKYTMEQGVIDFVESDARGTYKQEHFTIEDEEVDELRALIKASAERIVSFDFWEEPCDPKKCRYCDLRDSLIETMCAAPGPFTEGVTKR